MSDGYKKNGASINCVGYLHPVKKGAFPDNGVRPHEASNQMLSIYYAVTPYLYCVYSLCWDNPLFLLNLNSTHTIY